MSVATASQEKFAKRNDSIARAYLSGVGVAAISAKFGISPVRVYEIIRIAGITSRVPSHRRLLRDEKIRELHKAGISNAAIAIAAGCHLLTVSTCLRRRGLVANRCLSPNPTKATVLLARADGTQSAADIARASGCSFDHVCVLASRIRKLGFEIKLRDGRRKAGD